MKTEHSKPAAEGTTPFSQNNPVDSALSGRSGGSDGMMSPSHAGRDSMFLKSNLKELKDNYHHIEYQI